MSMRKPSSRNRLNGLWDGGVDYAQRVRDDWEEGARVIARRARTGLAEGRDAIRQAETTVRRSVTDHPLVFGLIVAGVVSFGLAAWLWDRDQRR
jgi:hypothetical protein